ncbi:MAG: class C sortase [Clostridiales bacterium]|nr:class C sortase [Clostridiales bacterium]
MRGKLTKCLAVLVLAAGLALMLYPWISNWVYEHAAESTASAYSTAVDSCSTGELEDEWAAARAYNEQLLAANVVLTDPFSYEDIGEEEDTDYDSVLNVDGSGVMCFIEIPKIDVYLPVYHGTSESALEKGAGHVEGTALPIGTEGGRPVISAHTGVNTAKMFSDLTDLAEGDLFFIHVLDETLAYRVVETQVIEPDDVSSISAQEGRDLVSLLTCTPYGVNTHRLVVTCERTDYTEEVQEEADAQEMDTGSAWMEAYKKALATALAIVGVLALTAWLIGRIRRKKR